ncbi:hypothetical protein C9422_20105 [Pseudomonas sp. B1(2018)]|uniref:hypothetical protein n=1 Tax=Pseudomonas sp. B1(2018) TaxID=2233856 RepID=UPI000D5F7F41|nr:hypothetical protein [Pseudomonas sp. B1(2018)]PVZ55778.1 hypothetical protein C9422_20105 [Pseudomonas sp. B1(2018)]
MDLLEEKREAETMAQLSFCFEAASSTKFAGSEIDSISSRSVADIGQAKSVVLSFPQNRCSSGTQAQLIQRILQRYRFF